MAKPFPRTGVTEDAQYRIRHAWTTDPIPIARLEERFNVSFEYIRRLCADLPRPEGAPPAYGVRRGRKRVRLNKLVKRIRNVGR